MGRGRKTGLCRCLRIRARGGGAGGGTGGPSVRPALHHEHAGQPGVRRQLDRELRHHGDDLPVGPRRHGAGEPVEQQPARHDVHRHRRRPDDVRLERGDARLARRGPHPLRPSLLRRAPGRRPRRRGGADPGRREHRQAAGARGSHLHRPRRDGAAGHRRPDLPGLRRRHRRGGGGAHRRVPRRQRPGRHRPQRRPARRVGARGRLRRSGGAAAEPQRLRRPAERRLRAALP